MNKVRTDTLLCYSTGQSREFLHTRLPHPPISHSLTILKVCVAFVSTVRSISRRFLNPFTIFLRGRQKKKKWKTPKISTLETEYFMMCQSSATHLKFKHPMHQSLTLSVQEWDKPLWSIDRTTAQSKAATVALPTPDGFLREDHIHIWWTEGTFGSLS